LIYIQFNKTGPFFREKHLDEHSREIGEIIYITIGQKPQDYLLGRFYIIDFLDVDSNRLSEIS
jgi:hypothetical protein